MVDQTEYQRKSGDELIKLVDENNNDLGGATRRDMRKGNLWHRASYIFIRNTK